MGGRAPECAALVSAEGGLTERDGECRAVPCLPGGPRAAESRNGNVCISPAGAAPLFVLIRQFSVWAVLSWVCSRCSACS